MNTRVIIGAVSAAFLGLAVALTPAHAQTTDHCAVVVPDWELEIAMSGPSGLDYAGACQNVASQYNADSTLTPNNQAYLTNDALLPSSCTTNYGPLRIDVAGYGSVNVAGGSTLCKAFLDGFQRGVAEAGN